MARCLDHAGRSGKCALSSAGAHLQNDLSNPTFLNEPVRFGGLSQRQSAADGQSELTVAYVIRKFSDLGGVGTPENTFDFNTRILRLCRLWQYRRVSK